MSVVEEMLQKKYLTKAESTNDNGQHLGHCHLLPQTYNTDVKVPIFV